MTKPLFLALHDASYSLPDGHFLFDRISAHFPLDGISALVGRNGVGKSLLGQLLAGRISVDSGSCLLAGSIHHLPQLIHAENQATVADLAGIRGCLLALQRIEAGSCDPDDFETVAGQWDIRQRLAKALAGFGLNHLRAEDSASTLSGGEIMKVALAGAFISQADWLILDEPSNHLDLNSRRFLLELIQERGQGVLLISHDRHLLQHVDRVFELTAQGLHSHGGNYAFYRQQREQRQLLAEQQLQQSKHQRKQQLQHLQQQHERQEQRQARGKRQRQQSSQAKILLDAQKERSQSTTGKLKKQQENSRQHWDNEVHQAASQCEQLAPLVLDAPQSRLSSVTPSIVLNNLTLPFTAQAAPLPDITLLGAVRIGVIGSNGCGKSTLLRVLAGLLQPLTGEVNVCQPHAYLDQQLSQLQPQLSLLEQLQQTMPERSETELRTRLARLRLNAQLITQPVSTLSGGERLKGALAHALFRENAARLLLLDEVNNHLDLDSQQALEDMLRQYRGALVVASHDQAFLDNLELTHHLRHSTSGWQLLPLS